MAGNLDEKAVKEVLKKIIENNNTIHAMSDIIRT